MNIRFIIKVQILGLIKWSYKPLIMVSMEPRIVSIFEHVVQSL